MTEKLTGLELLRAPFKPHQINKLPKPYKSDSPRSNCRECGGYHGMPAVHLDYVGHAALTDRLLEADPNWTWEPVALDQNGLPKFDENGGLWIRLTICGITRLGYGDSGTKRGANAIKEAIGDALRNAGMRFGAALDLWHKGDLHDAEEEQGKLSAPEEPAAPPRTIQRQTVNLDEWKARIAACSTRPELEALYQEAKHGEEAPASVLALIVADGTRRFPKEAAA